MVDFDLYDLLLRGDKTKDIRLMPEDVIFIPGVGPRVGIAGYVRRPAIYELKGETRLLDLIGMAGELASRAFKGRVQVQRTQDFQYRTVFESDMLDLEKKPDKNFVLQDGDLVKIFSTVELKNVILVQGAIANPGEYGIAPRVTKVKDIISLSGGLLYYASEKAELTRVKATQEGPKTDRLVIDLAKAMKDDPQQNIPLEANDFILVRSVPEWDLYKTVSVAGEVKFPGIYTITKGERLSSIIERAGGYSENAYLRGAVLVRESVRVVQRKSLDEMIFRLQSELFVEGAALLATGTTPEAVAAEKLSQQQKEKFVESLKQLQPTGRLTIKLANLRLLKGSEFDIELEEGDALFIPKRNASVTVVGAVMSRGSYVYAERMSYLDYVSMAGGYSKNADEDEVYALKVDGSARKLSKGFFNWNQSSSRWEMTVFGEEIKDIEPGDSIIVPAKLDRIAWLREIKDITQILMQIAVTAGVVIDII